MKFHLILLSLVGGMTAVSVRVFFLLLIEVIEEKNYFTGIVVTIIVTTIYYCIAHEIITRL